MCVHVRAKEKYMTLQYCLYIANILEITKQDLNTMIMR